MASKIGGRRSGVLPGGPVFTIVKIIPTVASFIDSLGAILYDVLFRKPSVVEGRAVVLITGFWLLGLDERYIANVMLYSINTLLNSKVMVVAAAPFGKPGERIYTWPSSLARVTDMITVGAVTPVTKPAMPYGSRYPWSIAIDTVTVNAPGEGLCGMKDGTIHPMKGPSIAAAVVTGLIAYFLAIPDLQEYFQAQPDWSIAVKNYVLAMSFPRHELVNAVWNGLDSEASMETYNTPGDPWIGIPYPGNPRFG